MSKKKKIKKQEKKRQKQWKEQRAKRGYADVDVWNHYDWFIHTTRKMLKQLKKTHIGFPPEVLSLANRNRLTSGKEKEQEYYSEKGSREWEDILDQMIFLLYEMDEEKCSQTNEYEEEYTKMAVKKDREKQDGWQQLKENYLKREQEISKYQDDCKNKFFKLYSKWFWSLWD